MNKPSPTMPEPIQPVSVRRHSVDWEASDLAEVTANRSLSLGPKLERGCWYLNPRFTVSSPVSTAEFFRKVIDLRSCWLRTACQVLGNHGQRREARKAERVGRLASFAGGSQLDNGASPYQPPLESVPWSALSDAQRREVIQSGRTAKNLAFSGVLFIDGDLIPPRTWSARARAILAPPIPGG